MKLFLTVVLASVLMMKTAEGGTPDLDATCVLATDDCPVNAECIDVSGELKCTACKATFVKPIITDKACKLESGQACTEDAACSDGACGSSRKKCGLANDATCTANANCASGNCMLTETDSASTEKCADAGAAGVVTSLLLMVATLMTSRIM